MIARPVVGFSKNWSKGFATGLPALKEYHFMSDVVTLAADIVAACVENNSVSVGDLPALITSTHGAFAGLGETADTAPAAPASRPRSPCANHCPVPMR